MSNYQVGDVYAVRPNPTYNRGQQGWAYRNVTAAALATVHSTLGGGPLFKIEGYKDSLNNSLTQIDPEFLTFVHSPEPKNVNETTYEIQDERGNEITLCRNDVRGTLSKGVYLTIVDDEDYLRGTVIPTENLDTFIEALESLKNPA